jgi:hypothetical protein
MGGRAPGRRVLERFQDYCTLAEFMRGRRSLMVASAG